MNRVATGKRRTRRRRAVAWAVLAGLLSTGGMLEARQGVPTTPVTSAPTEAAAGGKGEFVPVTRATLKLDVECDGWFEPRGGSEVRIRPRSYNGELRIESMAAHGSTVKAGDVLLKLDPSDIDRQIAAAGNEYELAKANLAKAEADVRLGDEADALAMKVQTDAEADARAAVEWFEKVTGPHFLKQLDLQVRLSRHNVEDQDDELDQLRKMYKSEDLTNATADIVVKRAVRDLELARNSLELAEQRAEKSKATDYVQQKRSLKVGLQRQQQATAALQVQQAQAKAQREAALFTARAAAEASKRKLDELTSDREQFTVAAQRDGVVIWGRLQQGNWQNSGFNAYGPGDKVPAEQVLATVFEPGGLVAVAAVPEPLVARVAIGQPVEVKPRSMPQVRLAGKVARVAPSATIQGEPPKFEVTIELNDAPDPRLKPGFRAAFVIDVDDAADVAVVPASAVSDGKVQVLGRGDAVEVRQVVTGRSDGERVEVIDGLAEGETLRKTFKKD